MASAHLNEQDIVKLGNDNFTGDQNEARSQFFRACFEILHRQSSNVDRPLLFDEIIRLESAPEKKIAFAVKRLAFHQKDYAHEQILRDYAFVEKMMSESGIKIGGEKFAYFADSLENELKRSIAAYVDTISGKAKSPNALNSFELARQLKNLIWYHLSWFPSSPSQEKTYALALENCRFLKDSECSLRMSRTIRRKENLKQLWPLAQKTILVSLEELTAKDPKYKNEYLDELKSFVATEKDVRLWLLFSKKLTALYFDDKKYVEAEPHLVRILQKEPSNENYYRLMLCLFSEAKHAEVIHLSNKAPKSGALAKEMESMVRESSLHLAKESFEKGDFVKYEDFIQKHLSLQTDRVKASLLWVDYHQKLLDRSEFNKALSLMRKVDGSELLVIPLAKVTELLIVNLFSMNRFQEACSLIASKSKFGQYPLFDPYLARCLILSSSTLGADQFAGIHGLGPEPQRSLLSLSALTLPQWVDQYYKKFPPVDEKDKKIWLVGRQMLEGTRGITTQPGERRTTFAWLPSELILGISTASEKFANQIVYPQSHLSQERLGRAIPVVMEQIKRLRQLVAVDLKAHSTDVQRRVIINAINAERRMGWFFDESPKPEGLNPLELKEYNAEIDQYAQGYYAQISEYLKLLARIELKSSEVNMGRLEIPADLEKWVRPQKGAFEIMAKVAAQNKFFDAMVILESLQNLGKLKPDDFYRWRSYLVMKQFPHEFSAHYLGEELEAAGQKVVIEEWRRQIEGS